jgi:N-acetylated-alpha-linked acidic dipeptidase
MSLADAETLPIRFNSFVRAVNGYVDELMKLTGSMRAETVDRNQSIGDRSLALAADPLVPFIATPESEVPYLDFALLQNALSRLQHSAQAFQDRERRLTGTLPRLTVLRLFSKKVIQNSANEETTYHRGSACRNPAVLGSRA